MEVNALTQRFGKIVKVITSKVSILNVLGYEKVETNAIWDTGATSCAITKSLAETLNLKVLSKTNVRGINGEHEANVYFVEIKLNNEKIRLCTPVTECDELSSDGSIGLLLGMDMITKGDFFITNHHNETVMTFRVPSLETRDFLEEITAYNKISRIHEENKNKGISTCPCGSGKDFKECHGKSIYNRK